MHTPELDLRDKVGILVRKAHFRCSQVIGRHLAPLNLNPRLYSILCILSYEEYAFNQQTVARMIAVTRVKMRDYVNELLKRGLITRQRFSDDRREYRLRLTPKGLQVYQEATKLRKQAEQELAEDFTRAEWQAGLNFLYKLCALESGEWPGSGR